MRRKYVRNFGSSAPSASCLRCLLHELQERGTTAFKSRSRSPTIGQGDFVRADIHFKKIIKNLWRVPARSWVFYLKQYELFYGKSWNCFCTKCFTTTCPPWRLFSLTRICTGCSSRIEHDSGYLEGIAFPDEWSVRTNRVVTMNNANVWGLKNTCAVKEVL